MKRLILIIGLCTASACGPAANPITVPIPPTPPQPNSAQTQVLHINNTLSDALRAAVTTAITLRDAGSISGADTKSVEDWALLTLDVKDQINKELGSTDSWEVQKSKIVGYLVGFKLPQATSNPILQATLTSVQTIVQQIREQVR